MPPLLKKIDVIIQGLQHTSRPTVFVEGKDDMMVFRWIERYLGIMNINFFPCGGRNTLLELFKRRAEFAHLKTLFIADRDMWVFTQIPEPYVHDCLLFTQGYSIENDLYKDGEQRIDELLDKDELIKKKAVLKNLIAWFAFETDCWLIDEIGQSGYADVSILSDKVMETGKVAFKQEFLRSRNFKTAKATTLQTITETYPLKLRGKFLFDLFQKIFQERTRGNKVIYQKKNLCDLCFREAIKDNRISTCMNALVQKVKTKFAL